MDWDAIGAIGETIGAVAVVISLLYLGVQIRSQTKQAQIAAMHDISVGFRETISHYAETEMAELLSTPTSLMT